MQIQIDNLRRGDVDTIDWSDLFDAQPTGPASWVVDQPGVLDIPFSRDLTADEVTLAQRRLESADVNEEQMLQHMDDFLAASDAFLANTSPSGADLAKQLRLVTRATSGLIRMQRRRIVASDPAPRGNR